MLHGVRILSIACSVAVIVTASKHFPEVDTFKLTSTAATVFSKGLWNNLCGLDSVLAMGDDAYQLRECCVCLPAHASKQ